MRNPSYPDGVVWPRLRMFSPQDIQIELECVELLHFGKEKMQTGWSTTNNEIRDKDKATEISCLYPYSCFCDPESESTCQPRFMLTS